jgi:anthranilate phosphoribosyltransferase
MNMTIQEAIRSASSGKSLAIDEARAVFTAIMSGEATPAQIAALIVALRMKGETVEEITGAAEVMREKATRVEISSKGKPVIDTCGTGGDGSNTFNISTAAAFVAAGAGAIVAKHGNRSVSSKSGSADVLEALGVNIGVGAGKMGECLQSIGIGFLFAPTLHLAMKFAIGPRKEIGIRTIFNIIGPLTNPAFASAQLLGVYSDKLAGVMARVLQNMGTKKAFVVHGMDPLDEISISSETAIAELSDNTVREYVVKPEDFGIKRSPLTSVAGGAAPDNARIIKMILAGAKGPQRDIVVLNAAFALAAAGIVASPKEGISEAEESIDSGAAREKLELLVRTSNG